MHNGAPPRPLTIHLVDVSAKALAASARTLSQLHDVAIVLHEATYETGLEEFAAGPRAAGRRLAVFLGSNIGNFDAPGADEFLRAIRRGLASGDGLLLGADLVKPERTLQLAYDDPLGVTAAFNRNLLVRINRELGGDFDLEAFDHAAVWNADASRVEMHLVARRPQRVRIPAADLDVHFDAGERIWTESSTVRPGAGRCDPGVGGISVRGAVDRRDRPVRAHAGAGEIGDHDFTAERFVCPLTGARSRSEWRKSGNSPQRSHSNTPRASQRIAIQRSGLAQYGQRVVVRFDSMWVDFTGMSDVSPDSMRAGARVRRAEG